MISDRENSSMKVLKTCQHVKKLLLLRTSILFRLHAKTTNRKTHLAFANVVCAAATNAVCARLAAIRPRSSKHQT